ncbi:uncharacterized protein CC84DRAFT_1166255 [Paraphaeosphaeria sporulosa]|uniref:Uncharacterized protein n=1 Tax=Paraphaeosphaeria sporulosa TaxID=1460663 RepID=A0A177CBA3_9PLEO|nr:uncharacterized protein CC84DRAFT_1166255 [Paraphaeosphaeria sporulosa]OAG04152.1 hypothetical protein CC84DRAFT_1166255 [Paraphaeosphaeria sporulosa]
MEVVYKKVDEYVDSLAPQIQPRVAAELDVFQQKTIDSLEDQVIDAFRSLFKKDSNKDGSRGDLNDTAPDAYGGQSLPFADEIAKLTRNFGKISDEAGDDLRDIFNLTEGRDGPGEVQARGEESARGSGARGFLASALDVVQDHLDDNRKSSGGAGFQLDGLLGVISNTVKDASRNPEEKARLISPEIKEKVGAKLREQHTTIAEQFTRIALEHIKRWLRGNTSSRDLGDGAKAEIEDQVKDIVKGIGGLFGKKHANEESSRGFNERAQGDNADERSGGFSKVISDKLSTGLAKVHREVRLEFRKILGAIERQLFELLPDQFQRPLEKILGGNPFDAQLDRDAEPNADRGFGDDIKAKLLDKIRDLVRKVQESLRENILGVVNGGHRKFERESWVFVQNIVEQKVQRYLPDVKISVPDDIGNEGVSVGAPTAGVQLGQNTAPAQGRYNSPVTQEQHSGQSHQQQEYDTPAQSQYRQDYRSDNSSQYQSSRPEQQHEYRQEQHQRQDYRPEYDQPYQHQQPSQYQSSQPQGYNQDHGYQQHQDYPSGGRYQGNQDYQRHEPNQGYQQHGGYEHSQGEYRGSQGYGGGPGYQGGQGYGQNPQY